MAPFPPLGQTELICIHSQWVHTVPRLSPQGGGRYSSAAWIPLSPWLMQPRGKSLAGARRLSPDEVSSPGSLPLSSASRKEAKLVNPAG